jgi:hypothetical protein
MRSHRFTAAVMMLASASVIYSSSELSEVNGVVTNSVTGEPIARARVTLTGGLKDGDTPQNYAATTGADGKFSLGKLAPASYFVRVDRVGFTMLSSIGGAGQNHFQIQAGDQPRELTLKLAPWGSISGRVLDADGEPLADVTVRAEQNRGGTQADTDEKGRFRIGTLSPGKYRLKVVKEDDSLPPEIRTDGTAEVHYATTYYPGSLDKKSATRIEVQPGSEIPGIEIKMIGVPIVGILGKVVGIPAGAKNLTLSTEVGHNDVAADGSFALWRVDPGHYSFSASGQTPNGRDFQTEWAEVDVGSSNVDKVELRVVPAAPLTGRLEFEDETAKQILHLAAASKTAPSHTPAQLALEDLKGNSGGNGTKIAADDSFHLEDVMPGKYRVSLVGAEGAYVKSMHLGQANIDGTVLDLSHGISAPSELILLLSSAMGSVSGIVRDKSEAPSAGVSVALANGEDTDRTLLTKTNADGAYSFTALKPGKYKLAIADPSDLEQLMDADDSADTIDIEAGQTTSKDLTSPN